MLAESNSDLLVSYIDKICEKISDYKNESAIRGISRATYYLSISKAIKLSKTQQEKLIEVSLDRLIGNAKIVPKVYAMHTLCHYAMLQEWIKTELLIIINKDFSHQSAGYKATAREILKKISK